MGPLIGNISGVASTNAVVPVPGSVVDVATTQGGNVSWVIEETGKANGITVTIDGSNDGVNWALAVTTVVVGAGDTGDAILGPSTTNLFFRFYRLALTSTVAGDAGTLAAQWFGI
jgi:hypothetical protein